MVGANITEIQYPVGQGGLHLGIFCNKGKHDAYIYDCGCSNPVTVGKKYLAKLIDDLANIQTIHIFISHLHWDHCNLLSDLLRKISSETSIKNKYLYMPRITVSEQVALLACLPLRISKQKYNEYFHLLTKRDDKYSDYIVVRCDPENDSVFSALPSKDFILDAFVENGGKFEPQGVSLLKDLENDDFFRQWRKEQTKSCKNLNYTMLYLYAGLNKHDVYYDYYHWCCCCHCCKSCMLCRYALPVGWMHTGDGYLQNITKTKFFGHYKKYSDTIGIMQIPHHGAKNYIDSSFGTFPSASSHIYYATGNTVTNGKVHPNRNHSDFTILSPNHVVTECPHSKIITIKH